MMWHHYKNPKIKESKRNSIQDFSRLLNLCFSVPVKSNKNNKFKTNRSKIESKFLNSIEFNYYVAKRQTKIRKYSMHSIHIQIKLLIEDLMFSEPSKIIIKKKTKFVKQNLSTRYFILPINVKRRPKIVLRFSIEFSSIFPKPQKID